MPDARAGVCQMSDMPTPAVQPGTPGVVARAIGMIFSPTETFRSIVQHPRPVGILFLVCLVIGLAASAPQFTEAGRQATLDMAVQQNERFSGQPVTPEMYAQLETLASMGPYLAIVDAFVRVPVFVLIFSVIYWAIFNIVLGGTATVKQVLGVTAHAQVIAALGAVAGLPIQLLQGTFTAAGPFNLGAVAPMLEPNSRLAMFLGGLTVFGIWQVIVNGLGIGVLYKRSPTSIILILLAIYLGLTAIFTVGMSLLMGR